MAAPIKMYDAASLSRLTRFWQKKLRLTDWKVTVRYAKQDEFEDGDGQGQCNDSLHARTAEIFVLHPDEYDPAIYPNNLPQDIEDVVVHELVHLHLAPWVTKNKAERIQMEQAVESITGALISFRHRSKKEKHIVDT